MILKITIVQDRPVQNFSCELNASISPLFRWEWNWKQKRI